MSCSFRHRRWLALFALAAFLVPGLVGHAHVHLHAGGEISYESAGHDEPAETAILESGSCTACRVSAKPLARFCAARPIAPTLIAPHGFAHTSESPHTAPIRALGPPRAPPSPIA